MTFILSHLITDVLCQIQWQSATSSTMTLHLLLFWICCCLRRLLIGHSRPDMVYCMFRVPNDVVSNVKIHIRDVSKWYQTTCVEWKPVGVSPRFWLLLACLISVSHEDSLGAPLGDSSCRKAEKAGRTWDRWGPWFTGRTWEPNWQKCVSADSVFFPQRGFSLEKQLGDSERCIIFSTIFVVLGSSNEQVRGEAIWWWPLSRKPVFGAPEAPQIAEFSLQVA